VIKVDLRSPGNLPGRDCHWRQSVLVITVARRGRSQSCRPRFGADAVPRAWYAHARRSL